MNEERPTKKQRISMAFSPLEGGAPPRVQFSRLAQHHLTFDRVLSPGASHSNRVALAALPSPQAAEYEAFVASGRHLYSVRLPRAAAFTGERGKEGVYIAEAGVAATAAPLDAAQHRAEVQHVSLHEQDGGGEAVLASVDCYGRALLARMRRQEGGQELRVLGVHQLQPADLLREPGWAGVSVAPGQPSQAAVARFFARDVTLFDGALAVQTIHTLYRPTAVQLLSSQLATGPGGGPLVAVAEGPQLSIWDVRGTRRGARVARLGPGPHHGHLYCIAAADDGGPPLLGAAGEERSVLVWDPRKWTLLDRWSNCLKYEATALHFSSGDPRLCCVAGMDYEVLCGEWGGNKASRLGGGNRAANNTHTGLKTAPEAAAGDEDGGCGLGRGVSFRGDSRWLGLAKAAGQDMLAGLTQSGQMYVAEFST